MLKGNDLHLTFTFTMRLSWRLLPPHTAAQAVLLSARPFWAVELVGRTPLAQAVTHSAHIHE